MSNKKIMLSVMAILVIMAGSIYSQDGESQQAKELDEFEKSLDSKILVINKKLEQYSNLLNSEVRHTPVQSRFRKGDGYIEFEKYDFVYESPSSTVIVGGKKKIMKLYYGGQGFSKIESEITEENYVLRSKKFLKVVDPSPVTEDNGDISVFRQLNKDNPIEFKLSEVQNTISNPNRIHFKKQFYLDFLTNLEEDLRYTKKYLDFYGTNAHNNTIDELSEAVNY